MQLTRDQEAAAAAFTHFMTTDETEMVLSGGAGVGKTTLLKHFMQLKDPTLICRLAGIEPIVDWELTATTNKAAEVLQEATGREAGTIHSFLGLKVYNDYDTGRTKITKGRNFKIVQNTLIVVDEASMIDRTLRSFIREATMNCKILYVGDHCQLAPVGEEVSPVFVDVENRNYLNEIVRSANTPAITALALQLRETVETGVFRPIQGVPGTIDFLEPTSAELAIRHYFVDHPELGENARILAFRNRQVVDFNTYIRQARNLPPELVVGDDVIACNAGKYTDRNSMLRIEQPLEVLVVGAKYPMDLVLNTGERTAVQVQSITTDCGTLQIPVDRLHWQAMIKYCAKIKDWPNYYKLQEEIADLRPREACTVHKSQGSTYHTVFVDLTDIGRCNIPSQVARMLYVACSRPTDRIFFIGRLPPKYGG